MPLSFQAVSFLPMVRPTIKEIVEFSETFEDSIKTESEVLQMSLEWCDGTNIDHVNLASTAMDIFDNCASCGRWMMPKPNTEICQQCFRP